MTPGYATPFQGNDYLVADVTNADVAVHLGTLLGALTSKRWSITSTDRSNWSKLFGVDFPEIKNCQILFTSTGAFNVCRDGATFPYAANAIAGPFTTQTLSNVFVTGTNVKVLIQF